MGKTTPKAGSKSPPKKVQSTNILNFFNKTPTKKAPDQQIEEKSE